MEGRQVASKNGFLLCLLLWLAAVPVAFAELAGTPLLTNFKPRDYNGGTQNWAIVQDQRGIIYVGNNVGVLEYDGAQWRMIPTVNKAVVRSLAVATDGRIYVGSKGELGFLETRHAQGSQYRSLMHLIPERYRDFQDVRQTFATSEGVYFTSRQYIFRFDGQTMKVWTTNTAFLKAFWVNNRFIVREEGTGLVELQQDTFTLMAGGEFFAEQDVFVLEQFNTDTLLAGSRQDGLYLLSSQPGTQNVRPWQISISDALRQHQIYSAVRLTSGDFAFGTTEGGVYIVTPDGQLKSHIDKDAGLVDENVRALYQDHQHGLWLALDHGLSRVDLSSALTFYNDANGLRGNVLALHKHNGVLYAGTSLGLYRKDGNNRFSAINEVTKQTWGFVSIDERLLIANSNGVYSLQNAQLQLVRPSELASKVLTRSSSQPDRIFIGLQDGLASMRLINGNWKDEGVLPGIQGNINSILEMADGTLWVGTLAHGVYHVTLPKDWLGGSSSALDIKQYTKQHGLPSNNRNSVSFYQQQLLLATVSGFYRFADTEQRFVQDTKLAAAFDDVQPWVRNPQQDGHGNLWLLTWDNTTGGRQAGTLIRDNNAEYHWQATALLPLQDIPLDTLYIDIRQTADSGRHDIIWFGGAEGIFRFAANEHRVLSPRPPLIRRLRTLDDNLLYAGETLSDTLKLDADIRSVRFDYASPNYSHLFADEFQVKLTGFDSDWSAWSTERYRDYTNLRSGDYTFEVRSKDAQGNLLTSEPLNFTIGKPWFVSWWAWLVYLLILILALFLLHKWRLSHLLREREQLTALVEQRTSHLKHAMHQLEQAKQRAESATAAKGEFLANMSHELRTPLNAVLGFAELAQQTANPLKQQSYLSKIRSSGRILLSIINDILDFSKIEAGMLQLEQADFTLADVVQQVTDMFTAQLMQKDLTLTVNIEQHVPARLNGDALRLSQVLINLLSNAIKFTERGNVSLQIGCTPADDKQYLLECRVIDTGIGISIEQQEQLFTAFSQADSSISRKYGGTGLGLAICQRLVTLMGGTLTVNSEPGQGSTFRFTVPLNTASATMSDAVESASTPPAGHTVNTFASTKTDAITEPETLLPQHNAEQSQTILLVEDNYFNQTLARIILHKLGHQVIVANSGEQALTLLTGQPVALILMDIEMPGINGLETTTRIRTQADMAKVPIIAMTAHHSAEMEQRCYNAGMNDMLSKPIDTKDLAAALKRWLK